MSFHPAMEWVAPTTEKTVPTSPADVFIVGNERAIMEVGVWTGGPGDMPDGLPIFNSLIHTTDEGYDGGVHDGFTAWLEQRGWYIENYDGQTMFIIPLAYAKELGEAA